MTSPQRAKSGLAGGPRIGGGDSHVGFTNVGRKESGAGGNSPKETIMRTAVFVNFLILIVAAFALAQVTPEEAVAPATAVAPEAIVAPVPAGAAVAPVAQSATVTVVRIAQSAPPAPPAQAAPAAPAWQLLRLRLHLLHRRYGYRDRIWESIQMTSLTTTWAG